MFHIPVWVCFLFLFLPYIGIKRCYTRVISLDRLAIIPAVFICLGLYSILQMFGISISVFVLLILGMALSFLIAYRWVRKVVIVADKKNRLIQVPGDISLLVMLMMIFFIEFFIHYAVDAHWAIADSIWFQPWAVLVTGFVVGISAGKNVTYFLKYLKADSVNLQYLK